VLVLVQMHGSSSDAAIARADVALKGAMNAQVDVYTRFTHTAGTKGGGDCWAECGEVSVATSGVGCPEMCGGMIGVRRFTVNIVET